MKTVEESKFRSHGRARDEEVVSSLHSPLATATQVPPPSHPILSVQQTMGNQAVRRMVATGVLQPKLTVGAPDDEYEKEADTVAERVMSFRQPQAAGASSSDDDQDARSGMARKPAGLKLARQTMFGRIPLRTLQKTLGNRELARMLAEDSPAPALPELRRKCACGGEAEKECDECRMSRMALQRSSTSADADLEAPPIVESVLSTPGQPLAQSARRTLEPGFGHDFSEVRVHDDSRAAESASAVSAIAYTVGNHIVFGAGQYAPGTNDGNRLLAHELTHTIQQTGGTPASIQRLSWDDVTDAASDVGSAVSSGAEAVGSAVSSGAEAASQAVSSGVSAVEGAVSSGVQAVGEGAQAVGQAVQSGAQAVAEGAQAVGQAVVSGVQSAGQAVASGAEAAAGGAQAAGQAVLGGAQAAAGAAQAALSGVGSTLADTVGSAALDAANAIAGLFGGKVSVVGTGIEIDIDDVEIAEVEDETVVVPLGIPTSTLFATGFEVGDFAMQAWAGTIYGDPELTFVVGPVRLQNIKLVLDPLAGTYSGTAQLYVGSAVTGSLEKADEARIQAEGVIPFDPPIPIWGSAEVGIRDIIRLVGKEGFTLGVAVGYSGGSFLLHSDINIKTGALVQRDHEAFLRIEVESEEICSMIWPLSHKRLAGGAVEINLPMTIGYSSSGGIVKIGKPTAKPFPVDLIETDLEDDHGPAHCKDLKEFAEFLCKKGKLPPAVCSIVAPAAPGGPGGLGGGGGTGPSVVPFGPGGGTGPGGGGPLVAGNPCRQDVSFQFKRRFFKTGPETNVRAQDSKHTKMAQKTSSELDSLARTTDCNSLSIPCEKEFCDATHTRDTSYGSQIDRATQRQGRYRELLEDAFRSDPDPPESGEWPIEPPPADATVGFDIAGNALTSDYTVHGNFRNKGKDLNVELFPGK